MGWCGGLATLVVDVGGKRGNVVCNYSYVGNCDNDYGGGNYGSNQ